MAKPSNLFISSRIQRLFPVPQASKGKQGLFERRQKRNKQPDWGAILMQKKTSEMRNFS